MRATLGIIATLQASFLLIVAGTTPSFGESFSLFSSSHPVTGKSGSLLSATTIQSCLVTSFRALDGEQRLDFFSLGPNGATHVDTRAFGNLLEDQTNLIPDANLRAPRDLGVINGAVIWWSNFKVSSATLRSDCRINKSSSFDFKNSLNSVFNRGEVSAQFASRRTVLSDSEVIKLILEGASNDEVSERQYKSGLFDFTNPEQPFLSGSGPQLGVLGDGTLERTILTVDGNSTIVSLRNKENLSLSTFTPSTKDPHVNAFYATRVPEIFNPGNLNRSLGDLRAEILSEQFLQSILDDVVLPYAFEVANVSAAGDLGAALQKLAPGNLKMQRLLTRFGLNDRSTIRSAVNAVVTDYLKNSNLAEADTRLNAEIASRIGERFYVTPSLPLSAISSKVRAAMQGELTAQGLEAYTVNTILAPLADDLPVLKTTFGKLLDKITENAAGSAVDSALGALDSALPDEAFLNLFLTGPSCLNIPNSSRQFIDLTLVKSGPKVNPDGLALFELLKLVDYYFENDDFDRLRSELTVRLNQLHADIADEIAAELTRGINFQGGLDLSVSSLIATRIPFRAQLDFSLQQHITEQILVHLESRGIRRDAKLRPTLLKAARGRTPGRRNGSKATQQSDKELLRRLTFGKFLKFITPRNPGPSLQSLLKKTLPPSLISAASLEVGVDEIFDDLFGNLPLSTSLGSAAQNFLRVRIDPNLLGTFVDETIGHALATMSANNGGIPIAVRKAWRASHGDCLAQWQVAFDIAAAASTTAQLPAVAAEFVAAEQLLGTALDESIKFVTQQTLSSFLDGVFRRAEGSYPRWHLGLQLKENAFKLSQLSGVTTRLADLAAHKDKLLILQRNNGASLPDSNVDSNVVATVFGLDGSKEVTSLGSWSTLSISKGDDGLFVLHGDRPQSSTILLDIRKGTVRQADLTNTIPVEFSRPDRVHVLPRNRMLLQSEVSGIHVIDIP